MFKKFFPALISLVAATALSFTFLLMGCNNSTTTSAEEEFEHELLTINSAGNGAPNGTHYNLNIIGVPKNKTADMTGNNGGRIFVPLAGKTKILLSEGSSYQVLDANGTDGSAKFQLPNPDPDKDGITLYSVWGRALGKPNGSVVMKTCATEVSTGIEYCSTQALIMVRNKGKTSFTDVSRELLYLYVDLNGDGVLEQYPLFDEALRDYFWSYDNNGLKLLQLRFYELPSNTNQ